MLRRGARYGQPGRRHVLFQTGDTVLVCRRLEGEFLAYRNAIPRNNPIHVECDARTLLASIDRVSLIISEKLKSPLRCVFGDGLVSITTKTGIGDAADQCPITGDGQELEIGFNNKYLMDALKAAPADRLRLEFSSGVAPCVILPAEGEENFIYMVLPVLPEGKLTAACRRLSTPNKLSLRRGQQLETGLESGKVLWRKQPFRSAQSSSSCRIC